MSRRLFGAVATVGALGLLVSLATVLRDLFAAFHFGTSDAADAFLLAILLPQMGVSVVAAGFIPSLIPAYVRAAEHSGSVGAERMLSSALVGGLALLVVLSGVFALAFPLLLPLLAASFSPEKRALTRELFYLALPVLPLSGAATIFSAALNANRHFATAAIAPITVPLASVCALVLAGEQFGIHTLALGAAVGAGLQCLVVLAAVHRAKIRWRLRWYQMSAQSRQLAREYGAVVLSTFLLNCTTLVDQAMAAMLGPGSVATLNYGGKLASFVAGIGALALGQAVLPHFAHLVATGDRAQIRATLGTCVRWVLLLTIPLVVLLVVLSDPIVRMLFERGAFGGEDTAAVTRVQVCYLLQIPFYILSVLLARLVSSLQRNRLLLVQTMVLLVLDIVLNFLLMHWIGVAGIALATSIVHATGCVVLAFVARHYLGRDDDWPAHAIDRPRPAA